MSDFPTESHGIRLAEMKLLEAKQLRRRFGNEKYGEWLRPCSMLAEGYIEIIDILNYLDYAYDQHEMSEERYKDLVLDVEKLAAKFRHTLGKH